MSSSIPSTATTTARPLDPRPAPSAGAAAAADWQVPAYDADVYHPRSSRYAVCLFVLNEAERIVRQLSRMQEIGHPMDVVIADGGSSDGSTCRETLEPLGVNTLLVKRGPGRLSAQMRMALAWCLARGYEGVIVMDGNNKDDPAALPQFAALLAEGYDHVQGSRFIPGGRAINTPRSRYWGVRLLHSPLLSCAARFRYTDTTNGFRGYSARFLCDPRVSPFRDVFSGYELHYYLAICAARLGFRVIETPVTRAYPRQGPTPTKIHGFRGNLKILGTLVSACLGRYDVPPSDIRSPITRKAA